MRPAAKWANSSRSSRRLVHREIVNPGLPHAAVVAIPIRPSRTMKRGFAPRGDMDERTLTGRFKSWVDEAIAGGTFQPIDGSDTETHPGIDLRRHDLILRADGRPALTAEFKLPTDAHGASPFDLAVVRPAHEKAVAEGVAYFATCNCSSFVLWQTDMPGVPLHRSYVKRWRVVSPENLTALDGPLATQEFRAFVPLFLGELQALLLGTAHAEASIEEDQLVELIEDRLWVIVGLSLPAVEHAFHNDPTFRRQMKDWMLSDQGWTWDDTQARELLFGATQVGCYLFMNQILFYEAMRRVFRELPTLDVEAAVSGEGLAARLRPRFDEAMAVSRDYESVFQVGFITEVVFKSDAAVHAWVGLVGGVQDVDLARYSTDLLGSVFERLLSPEERHRFGQHYTSPELADVLLAAAVRRREDRVFDPAAGGGTFLVRAYDRLRSLGERDHLVLLSRIYGNDVSRFATHLSTINLAVRSLAREENYPRVGTHDFLRLDPGAPLVSLPLHGGDQRVVQSPDNVEVMIGNPPYVKRRSLSRDQLASAEASLARNLLRPQLHGLSDLHAYFWPQAARYLLQGGRLALLTSSSWLDSTSGSSLKAFIKAHFRIRVIVESEAEPWFSDARVGTIATVLERELEAAARDENEVVFARVHQPLGALLGPRQGPHRWARAEAFVTTLFAGTSTADVTALRVVQGELEDEESWAEPLRAPAIFGRYRVLRGVRRLTDAFSVTVGPKLGNAKWFVVSPIEDPSDDLLARCGVTRQMVAGPAPRLRIVEGYLGWRGPIESRFLRRAARGPRAQATRELRRTDGDLVVMIPRDARIRGTKVADYIAWGEGHGVHRTYYVRHRAAHWYSVEVRPSGTLVMPSSSAFAWKVWRNPGASLMTTSPNASLSPLDGVSVEASLAVLNSTWTYLAATQAASHVGVEGVIRFGGLTQYQRLRAVDPAQASAEQTARLISIWNEMRGQDVLDFPPAGEEQLGGWRRELDELVLRIAGVEDRIEASEWVDELYSWLRENVGRRADVEQMALAGRRRGRRVAGAGRLVAQAVAAAGLHLPFPETPPLAWHVFDPPAAASTDPQAVLFGMDGHVEGPNDVRFDNEWVRFDTEAEAAIVRSLAAAGLLAGPVVVPSAADAEAWAPVVAEFVAGIPVRLREELGDRIGPTDPSYPEAFAMALSMGSELLRREMADRVELFRRHN